MHLSKQAAPYAVTNDEKDRRVDEGTWVEQVRRGSKEVFEMLFRAYYADLVVYVQAQVQERDLAEELVQEIFLDIWNQGEHWQPMGALRPYLYGAARKKCLMLFRHRRTRGRWKTEADVKDCAGREGPEDAFQYNELQHAVEEAVGALPERRRLIFILSRYQGLTYAEIAAVLGLSVNTVRNQMAQALQFLRKRLAPYLFTLL